MDLDEWLERNPPKKRKQGFPGVMDRVTPEHRQQAIDGYHAGLTAKDIRQWLSSVYPDLTFTQTNFDSWLYKQHPRVAQVDD